MREIFHSGVHGRCVPSAAVKHISSEAEMPLTIMKEGLSPAASARHPQDKSKHAMETWTILAIMSLSFLLKPALAQKELHEQSILNGAQ